MAKTKVSTIWIEVGGELVEARVTTEKDGFSARFPKYDGCFTEGNSLPHLIEMAREVVPYFQAPPPAWESDPEGQSLDRRVRRELGVKESSGPSLPSVKAAPRPKGRAPRAAAPTGTESRKVAEPPGSVTSPKKNKVKA